MAAAETLVSPEDLEGATVVSAPTGRHAGGTLKLSAADLEGATTVTTPPVPRRMNQPRELTDEEAGVATGPITARMDRPGGFGGYHTEQAPARADAPASDYVIRRPLPGGGERITVDRGNPNEMADPLVQMGTAAALGVATGQGARSIAGAVPAVGASLAPAAGMAAEGAVANKAMGGDASTGAALGLVPLVPKIARGAARVVEPSGRALIKDIAKGTTKAPKAMVEDVKFAAGPEGERLTQVLAETPKARRAVAVKAKTDPKGAAADLDDVIGKSSNLNKVDYAAIQRQHGGVDLAPITERLNGLSDRVEKMGHTVEADAIRRVNADWMKRFGKGDPAAKLGVQQIVNMRNDIGELIDPNKVMDPNTKHRARARMYALLNKEIEDVAAQTRGVDVAALKQRNRQISTLIPVRDALAERAETEADMGAIARAKRAPANAVRRGLREARVGAARLGRAKLEAPAGATAATTAVAREHESPPLGDLVPAQ